MKRIQEEDNKDKDNAISNFSMMLQEALKEEFTAVQTYKTILGDPEISESQRAAIQELLNDENDHCVIISTLIQDSVEDDLPDFGDFESDGEDEDEIDKPDEDEDFDEE